MPDSAGPPSSPVVALHSRLLFSTRLRLIFQCPAGPGASARTSMPMQFPETLLRLATPWDTSRRKIPSPWLFVTLLRVTTAWAFGESPT